MRFLVIGGTGFLGRHVVAAMLAAGHEVTMFNRGVTDSELFPEVERVRGDRDGGLEPLRGWHGHFVIDTCGYVPRLVRESAELLDPMAAMYCFISTESVYAEPWPERVTERSPLGRIEDPTTETVDEDTYGPLKALCERAVHDVYGDERTLIVRPGLIVGPHDPTDRFTHWVRRVASGGEVLAPDSPEYRAQFIDVRDLAAWIVLMVERGMGGVFNADGPPVRFGDLLEACRGVSGSDATFTWAPEEWLLERGVKQWSDVPLWIAGPAGKAMFDVSKAVANGLSHSPIEATIQATLEWDRGRVRPKPMLAGLSAEREAGFLSAWNRAR